MTEHTPGPWTQPETKRTHNRWFVEGGGRLVAAASGPQFAIPADEADANARLIASAPDLLAVLQKWAAYANELSWASACELAYLTETHDAIAKATGG